MDSKKESTRGAAATGSKMAASKKQGQGGEQDLVQHAKQATGEIVNQVQHQAGSQIERQKESAAEDLSKVVTAVKRFGETLTTEQGGPIARYAAEYGDKAAQKLEQLTNYIREQDPKKLLDDVQNFGRRRPALLIGGAFLIGLAGARLIKSSMDTSAQQWSRGNVPPPNLSSTNVPAAQPSATPGAI